MDLVGSLGSFTCPLPGAPSVWMIPGLADHVASNRGCFSLIPPLYRICHWLKHNPNIPLIKKTDNFLELQPPLGQSHHALGPDEL